MFTVLSRNPAVCWPLKMDGYKPGSELFKMETPKMYLLKDVSYLEFSIMCLASAERENEITLCTHIVNYSLI